MEDVDDSLFFMNDSTTQFIQMSVISIFVRFLNAIYLPHILEIL